MPSMLLTMGNLGCSYFKPCLALAKLFLERRLENAFGDGCNNERNANKKLFLLIENYLVYNIVWPRKSNIFFNSTKSKSYLNYEFFYFKSCILPC